MATRRLARPASAFFSSSWTCPTCTRASSISTPTIPRAAAPARRLLHQTRPLHREPPRLTYAESFERHGIPGLLSPHGYNIAWLQYQSQLIQKLDDLTAGESFEDDDPKTLVIRFARDPMAASLFNHASMAHNNHFFFNGLSVSPLELYKSPALQKSLIDTFGSIETLKMTMVDTAAAMFGPGFVWLVWARDLDSPTTNSSNRKGAWRILSTYLAGTPYPEAGYRQQGLDTNTTDAPGYDRYMNQQPVNTLGAFGSFSRAGREQSKLPPGGTNIMPVLCVNTWEHVYLRDFGVNGKREYLEDWWNCIDWDVVENLTPPEGKGQGQFFSKA